MLYRKYLVILIFATVWVSCNNTSPASPGEKTTIDSIQYSFHTISRELVCKEDTSELCLDVKIKEVKLKGGPSGKAVARIGAALEKAIIETDNSPGEVNNPEELAANITEEYKRISREMPDYSMPWSYNVQVDIFLNRQGLFGAEINTSSFTGGAHGNYFTFYYLYDIDNGQRIHIDDLLKDNAHSKLLSMADQQFRESRQLGQDADYNEMGYWFEDNVFTLPENFKYSEGGIEFRYNPYEIAPYSEGEIILLFPLSEVQELIKPKYQIAYDNKKEVL